MHIDSKLWVIKERIGNSVAIDFLQVKKSDLIIRALNRKMYQRILKVLNENGKLTSTEVVGMLKTDHHSVSQHLAILRRAAIVKTEREGKLIHYSLNQERIVKIWNCFVNELTQ